MAQPVDNSNVDVESDKASDSGNRQNPIINQTTPLQNTETKLINDENQKEFEVGTDAYESFNRRNPMLNSDKAAEFSSFAVPEEDEGR